MVLGPHLESSTIRQFEKGGDMTGVCKKTLYIGAVKVLGRGWIVKSVFNQCGKVKLGFLQLCTIKHHSQG